MADFIVEDDDDINKQAMRELRKVTKGLGPREQHQYDSDDSDMEARFEDI